MSEGLMVVLDGLKDKAVGRKPIPLPDGAFLDRYQDEIGFRFPQEYRVFLKEVMNVFYGTKDPFVVTEGGIGSHGELRVALRSAQAIRVPKDWLPICEDNGDYYCIAPDGSVRFWSHDGPTNERWQDLSSWVKNVWIEGH